MIKGSARRRGVEVTDNGGVSEHLGRLEERGVSRLRFLVHDDSPI